MKKKKFKKNIENMMIEYDNTLKKTIDENHLKNTIKLSKKIVASYEYESISYLEFLYTQLFFIKKIWWVLQATLLIILGIILKDVNNEYNIQRLFAIASPLFVIFILPEIHKNINSSSIEIDNASYFSLKGIYSARILIFGLVDISMISIFFILTNISLNFFLINFVIPFNMCCCICFRSLFAKNSAKEYSILGLVVWIGVWMFIVTNKSIYKLVILHVWILLLTLSFIYLFYCIKRTISYREIVWEV